MNNSHSESVLVTQELASILSNNPAVTLNIEFTSKVYETISDYRSQFLKNWHINKKDAALDIFRAMDELIRTSKSFKKSVISCRRGCSFCCRILINISEIEATILADYCQENGIEISKNYLEEQMRLDEKAFLSSKVSRCIFLKDHECSVYAVRPLACRRYYVKSDPQLCNARKFLGNQQVQRVTSFEMEMLLSAVIPTISQGQSRMSEMLMPYAL
ncbi:YkgJ family cysteine cluster protein [Chitinophaga sp. YIM B06452]|uniref:YkgJ family cysteine cluster protein n=1 Tax=Chitinophaga sp. YIM B06452 TaxID=3082158 RepID=UPI0031FE9012